MRARFIPSMRIALVVIMLSAFTVSCSTKQNEQTPASAAPQTAYEVPPEGTSSLIDTVTTSRSSQGALVIYGLTKLPYGTNIAIAVYRGSKLRGPIAETKLPIAADGSFTSGPLDAPEAGVHSIEIISYFNAIWQSPAVLALVGRNGVSLPNSALEPDDSEFPDQGGSLHHIARVKLDPLPVAIAGERQLLAQAEKAITTVKTSKLVVQGKGRAVDTVAEIVQYFDKPGVEFYPGQWSATRAENGHWKVSLEHRWGREQKVADWDYDPRSGRVRYLNAEAKMLSWIPAE
jgi:hypothetical protein